MQMQTLKGVLDGAVLDGVITHAQRDLTIKNAEKYTKVLDRDVFIEIVYKKLKKLRSEMDAGEKEIQEVGLKAGMLEMVKENRAKAKEKEDGQAGSTEKT